MFHLKKSLLVIALLSNSILFSQTSMNTTLLFHWDDESLQGSESYNNSYNEIWGLVQDDKEYAIIGSTDGTHIFDVTVPGDSYQAAFIAGEAQGPQIVHRDFHDYNGYLYIVSDEGASSLQIVDVSNLPDTVITVYDSNQLFQTAHNIFIDTATAKLYTTNGTIYSVENPESPTLLYQNSVLKCHDMYVLNDTAFINAENTGLIIADFSQTTLENQTHEVLGTLFSYPQQGYNHSGWPSADGQHYIMADETWGMDMKMVDVSDFTNMEVVSLISSEIDVNSIPHNQIINGDFLYTAYYHDGFYVHDISDPLNPVLIAFYDTFEPDHHDSYMGAWGVYPFLPSGNILMSDMQTGLYVFNVDYTTDIISLENDLDFSVYPNPTKKSVNINLNSTDIVSLEVYNMHSQLVYKQKFNNNLYVDIAGFNLGIYLFKLEVNGEVYYKKIIKQ